LRDHIKLRGFEPVDKIALLIFGINSIPKEGNLWFHILNEKGSYFITKTA
jgi:hypothetical protein